MNKLESMLPTNCSKSCREGRGERKRKRKKKHRDDDDDDDDDDEDDDEMYHPSQDYNDNSQVDPEFRPTRRELREADKEGDS